VLAKIGPLDNGLHVDTGFQHARLCVRIPCSWPGSRARTTEHRASVQAVDGLELPTLARANQLTLNIQPTEALRVIASGEKLNALTSFGGRRGGPHPQIAVTGAGQASSLSSPDWRCEAPSRSTGGLTCARLSNPQRSYPLSRDSRPRRRRQAPPEGAARRYQAYLSTCHQSCDQLRAQSCNSCGLISPSRMGLILPSASVIC
jgi:hypothetical protein